MPEKTPPDYILDATPQFQLAALAFNAGLHDRDIAIALKCSTRTVYSLKSDWRRWVENRERERSA